MVRSCFANEKAVTDVFFNLICKDSRVSVMTTRLYTNGKLVTNVCDEVIARLNVVFVLRQRTFAVNSY